MQTITRRAAVVLLVLSLSFTLAADAPKPQGPRSPDALGALAKLEAARKKNQAAFDTANREVVAEAVKQLEEAKAAAMKAGNLQEANAIQTAIESVGKTASAGLPLPFVGRKLRWDRDHRMGNSRPGGAVLVARRAVDEHHVEAAAGRTGDVAVEILAASCRI